jgi:hypothetical protein
MKPPSTRFLPPREVEKTIRTAIGSEKGRWMLSVSLLAFLILSFVENTLTSAELRLTVTRGAEYSLNMGTEDPPFYLGLPVTISASSPAEIQSATLWIDLGPVRVESVEPAQPEEFEVSYTQEDRVLKLNLKRLAARTEPGEELLRIHHNRSTFGDPGLHFGRFKWLTAEAVSPQQEPLVVDAVDGSWWLHSDLAAPCHLKLVGYPQAEPLVNVQVLVTGYGEVPNLFETPLQEQPTDAAGETFVYFYPEPTGLFKEQDGCYVPRRLTLDIWLRLVPPADSGYADREVKIAAQLQTSCGEFTPFADAVYELMPTASQVSFFEEY